MTEPARSRVAVVGGGIGGLACAYRLHQLDPTIELVVLEADDRVGGKVRTSSVAGIVVDEAADAFLARVPDAIALCDELGLADQFVTPASRRAFVFRHGALHPFPEAMVLGVPTDLTLLRASGLISDAGLARAELDLTEGEALGAGPRGGADESVGALVRRRIGDEIFEAFVAPLLSGVNAGDADALSLAAGAPQLAAAVRDQPSLIAGLRAQRAAALAANPDPEAPVFYGLRGGSQTLTDALAAALPPGSVRTGTRVTALHEREGGGFLLDVGDAGDDLVVDSVVLATPSFASADVVEPIDAELASGLRSLEWADVVLVTFVARRADIEHPLDGSGFLVSEGEGLLMSACSFGSTKWAHWNVDAGSPEPSRSGDDPVVLRASAGRHHDRRALGLDDDALVEQLRAELQKVIGWSSEPLDVRISRWTRALPQYRPGHLGRARAWKARAATHPGLFLTGASYFGLGIPACIADGDATARQVIDHLTPSTS